MTASNTYGRQVVLPLTNKSGGSVAAGDVVIVDTSNNDAFTTTTSAGFTGMVGIATGTIANNAVGLVLVSGYASLVNVNASVTRGNFGKTFTVAKQASDAGSSRGVGTFCQFLTGGTTPDAVVYPVDLLGSSLTNPMTTKGDIIQADTGGTPARLAAGTSGQVLTSGGAAAFSAWATPAGVTFYGARAIRTTTQSITNVTPTAASFDSETAPGWDVGGVHDVSTNPSRFTVPTGGAGKWMGMGGGSWDANGSVGRFMWWIINNTTRIPGSDTMFPAAFAATEGGYNQQCFCPPILLADGDYLELIIYQDSGGTRTIGSNSLAGASLAASVWRIA